MSTPILTILRSLAVTLGCVETNYEKFRVWAWRVVYVGGLGLFAGAIVGGLSAPVALPDWSGWAIVGAVYGAALLGALPAAIAAWFLLLHMTGQASRAVRGPSKKRKRQRQR